MFRHYFLFIFSILCINCELQEGYYCYGNGIVKEDVGCRFFAVVIDAGSTGTRLHLYRYVHNIHPDRIPYQVEEEIFQEVKPGLSSFADKPGEAAASVRQLLTKARSAVPHFMWEKTPVALKATAGLRLLPGDLADDILSEVEEEVFNSGFLALPNAVSIMSGSDEGLYSWFTLNLLLNTLYSNDATHPRTPRAEDSVAAFDLGGGSTQLTYWPADKTIFKEHPDYERDIQFFDYQMRLFTHSFLGNGLNAARLRVLQLSTPEEMQEKENLLSHCLPEGFELKNWEYSLKYWHIRGTSQYSYSKCHEITKDFVKHSQIMKLPDLDGKLVYLFSYFFDRGLNAGLVKDLNGGELVLHDFKLAAEQACARPSTKLLLDPHWNPWLCHDLTYIYSLLHNGYGFKDSQPIFLAKKLRGMEVAWGQGLSYAVVNEFLLSVSPHSKPLRRSNTNSTVVKQLMSYIYEGTSNVLSYFNIIS